MNDEISAIPAYPIETVIDTTGAGDSFKEGLCYIVEQKK